MAYKASGAVKVRSPLPIAVTTDYGRLKFAYIKTTSGWGYTAFIIDVFARVIVGWRVSNRMNTAMVMAALEQERGTNLET